MGLETQGAKPTGFIGKLIGRLMNKFHTQLYIDYFTSHIPAANSKILDIGCGGGKFLKYLSEVSDTYTLFGLDHSEEMIALSERVNQAAIAQNRLKLFTGSVTEIPLDDSSLDWVTAFETVQFWPDINQSFSEVARALKSGGRFLIINYYPREGSKWWKLAKLKSVEDYKSHLAKNGFTEVNCDLTIKKGWIVVEAIKE